MSCERRRRLSPRTRGREVRDPVENQEAGIVGDKAEPRIAPWAGPAETGITNRESESARLPADKRKPGPADHRNMATGATVEPLEAETVALGNQPVPASLLFDAANGPDTHVTRGKGSRISA